MITIICSNNKCAFYRKEGCRSEEIAVNSKGKCCLFINIFHTDEELKKKRKEQCKDSLKIIKSKRMAKMKCYNNYCLFYKKGNECTMEKVTIGYLGKCSECIEVSFTEEELNKKREETLIKLGKYPGF